MALALALNLPLAAMQAGPVAAEVGGAAVSLELFDPSALAPEERLYLQAALALSGDYTGVLDGDWGEDSRAALNDWTRRETGRILPRVTDLGPLVVALETEIGGNGWQIVQSEERGISYLFPFALLEPDPEGEEPGASWISQDGGFGLMLSSAPPDEVDALHDYLLGETAEGSDPFHAEDTDWRSTAVDLDDGTRVMAMSERIGPVFETMVVLATETYLPQMSLLAASFVPGRLDGLTLPAGGVLAGLPGVQGPGPEGLMAEPRLEPEGDGTAPPDTDTAESPADEATGSGTAFYVAPDILVTAAHVVRGCGEMRRIDGLPLTVLAAEEALDLAVMQAPEPSQDWLDMGAAERPRLGEPVTALGFPYLGNLGQGLTVTGGNVSALKGIDGGEGEIMISAPVQPGNSGGPLLNASGAVIGVVVARVDDLAILEETGTLPQNMNFAVPSPVLSAWLGEVGVALPEGRGTADDLRAGISDRIARSVVAVLCYGE